MVSGIPFDAFSKGLFLQSPTIDLLTAAIQRYLESHANQIEPSDLSTVRRRIDFLTHEQKRDILDRLRDIERHQVKAGPLRIIRRA